ncbi:MAG: anaerobic sulfite reductase subunit AsrA [Lentisphaeria bacterium]|jgi:anaerobic sulfite reductase subunit A
MGTRLSLQEFDQALAGWGAAGLTAIAPALMPRGGRFSDQEVVGYRPVTRLAEFVLDRKSFFSPKETLFPIRETLFRFRDGAAAEPAAAEGAADDRPRLIFLRPCDRQGFDRLDSIFLRNGPEPDPYYARRRERVKFALIECTAGFDSCFCVSMGTNRVAPEQYALAARFAADAVTLEIRDPELAPALAGLGAPAAFAPEFVRENRLQVRVPPAEQVTPELFADPLWREYSQRCIGCGRCNTSCVTCSCFNMQDVLYDAAGRLGERRRVWTGCHLDGFTAMAGGHEFRKECGDRMRFKTMHKINDFQRRFGQPMCVGCGRCEDVCPEYISFARCVNRLDEVIRKGRPDGESVSK